MEELSKLVFITPKWQKSVLQEEQYNSHGSCDFWKVIYCLGAIIDTLYLVGNTGRGGRRVTRAGAEREDGHSGSGVVTILSRTGNIYLSLVLEIWISSLSGTLLFLSLNCNNRPSLILKPRKTNFGNYTNSNPALLFWRKSNTSSRIGGCTKALTLIRQ